MELPSKVVSLWFWPQLEQALVPSCIPCMDNGLVSHNFPAVLSAYTKMLQYFFISSLFILIFKFHFELA